MAALLPEYAEHVVRIIEARRALLPRWYQKYIDPARKERVLLEQIRKYALLIGGITDEVVEDLPVGDPQRDQVEIIRNEVAALSIYIAEVLQ